MSARTVHVVPVSDAVEHSVPGGYRVPGVCRAWVVVEAVGDADEDCVCVPSVQHVAGSSGDGWVVTHHSLDGRERGEWAGALS